MSFFINNINNSNSSYRCEDLSCGCRVKRSLPAHSQLQTLTTKEAAYVEYHCDINGLKHGDARAYLKNGDIIDFVYVHEKPQGNVVETWADGTKLHYEIQNGYRHGRACVIWPNQVRMDYHYCFGIKQGEATETYPDGTQFIFEFQNNAREGMVFKQTFQSRMCVGEYIDGRYRASEINLISVESSSEDNTPPPILVQEVTDKKITLSEDSLHKEIKKWLDEKWN